MPFPRVHTESPGQNRLLHFSWRVSGLMSVRCQSFVQEASPSGTCSGITIRYETPSKISFVFLDVWASCPHKPITCFVAVVWLCRGRRCATEGCERGAAGASSFCKKHGGGHRCLFPGCDHSSQGPSSFCIRHGGGYRCRYPDCDKSARSAQSFCYRHGGGRKGCEAPGCTEIAVGTTTLCKKHTRSGVDLQQRTAVPTERAAACLLPHSTEAQTQMGRPPYMAGFVAGHEAGSPYVPSCIHPGAIANSLNASLSDDPSTKTSLPTDMTDGDSSYLSF